MTDYDKLRSDLRDYYGTAMFNGNPMAMMELEEVERASGADLERIARNNGFDLSEYEDRPSAVSPYDGAYTPSASSSSGAGVSVGVHTQTISAAATRFFEPSGSSQQSAQLQPMIQSQQIAQTQPTAQPQQETKMEYMLNMQADEMMNKALGELEDRLADAERDFENGQSLIDIKTKYSISDISQLADIVSEANRITEELYANYESLVRAANSICKPFADQGVMPETLSRMVKFLEHINSECSTLGSNFSASVNDTSFGNVAATRYSPTAEARMIETNWKLLHSMHPDVEGERKRKEEKKRLEKEQREEKRRLEREKAIAEYPALLAQWEKDNAEAEAARAKWMEEAKLTAEREVRDKIEKTRADALKRAQEQAAEGGRMKKEASVRIKSAGFFQVAEKLAANEDMLKGSELIAKANEIAKHAQEEYAKALESFASKVEVELERKKRQLDSEIPLPRKPRDPNSINTSEPDPATLTPVQLANIEAKEAIYDTLAEEGRAMTLTDIMSCCDEVSDMSNQRVSALVRQLVTDGRVERFEEKRLAYFRAYEA